MENLTDLRAEVAMRAEDLRIARKDEERAAATLASTPGAAAWYKLARDWRLACAEREQEARGRLIRATV